MYLAGPNERAVINVLGFALAIYGGLYCADYVTIMTAIPAAFFAMPFAETIGGLEAENRYPVAPARMMFVWQGLVDLSSVPCWRR